MCRVGKEGNPAYKILGNITGYPYETIFGKYGLKLSQKIPFEELKEKVRLLGFTSSWDYCKKKGFLKIPGAPSSPNLYYKQEWGGWSDFIGFDKMERYSLKEFKHVLKRNGISLARDYEKFAEKDRKLPKDPSAHYKSTLKRLGFKAYVSYHELREKCLVSGIFTCNDYFKNWRKIHGAPACPWRVYKEWVSWHEFFGKRKFKKFGDALEKIVGSSKANIRSRYNIKLSEVDKNATLKERKEMKLKQYIQKKDHKLTSSENLRVRGLIDKGWDCERIATKVGCVPIQVAGVKAAMTRGH